MIYARQNYLGLLPILLARMYHIPYFAEFNNITGRAQYSLTNIKLLIKNVFEYSCLKAANIVITPSLTLKNRIIQRYKILPNKIYVVSNGVNEELFHPHRHMKVTRNKLGLNDSDFVVGFVGSMGEWQGIEVLKKAIMFTLDEYDKENIKFLIVGDYDKDSNLTRIKAGLGQGQRDIVTFIQTNFLESNVFYQSHVSYEDSADYMKICDVLVAPYMRSSIEYGGGSPLKLYAYLGCEKSVIISDLGDFTDSSCLREYEAAFLVHPDDGHAIKDAIITLKKNKKLREKLSRNGRDFVLKRRRWSLSCLKLKSIYEHEFGH
jgi:glycosyltransferase involved in cell wall biosynthesis